MYVQCSETRDVQKSLWQDVAVSCSDAEVGLELYYTLQEVFLQISAIYVAGLCAESAKVKCS